MKSSFIPGDKNIKESAAPVQDSIVNVMEESQFGLVTAKEEVSVTNFASGDKPLTKANIGLVLNFF